METGRPRCADGPFAFLRCRYFDVPVGDSVELEPMPDEPVLGEEVLGDDVLGEALVPPADEEPDAPCSRRQRSFSEPVMLSHCVLEPTLGVLPEALPLVLGEALGLEPVAPLVEPEDESLLPVALGLEPTLPDDDEDWASAAAENANSAAIVVVPMSFNIGCFSWLTSVGS